MQYFCYFNPIDSNTLDNVVVDDAQVFVEREDGIIHTLTHVDQSLIDSLNLLSDTIELPLQALYIDLSYQEHNFSQINYRYTLKVVWKNDTILATTFIPPPYPIDSVWVKRKDIVFEEKNLTKRDQDIIFYALFLMLNGATDVAIHILLIAVKELSMDLSLYYDDPVLNVLDKEIQVLFKKINLILFKLGCIMLTCLGV